MLNFSIRRHVDQPAAGIIGTTKGAGLHSSETAEGGGTSEKRHIRTRFPRALPMLMNVSKQHGPQGAMGTQQLLKTSLIEEPDRIHAGITDGDWWMVKGDHQGQITALRTLQALRQPTKLKRAELAGS